MRRLARAIRMWRQSRTPSGVRGMSVWDVQMCVGALGNAAYQAGMMGFDPNSSEDRQAFVDMVRRAARVADNEGQHPYELPDEDSVSRMCVLCERNFHGRVLQRYCTRCECDGTADAVRKGLAE